MRSFGSTLSYVSDNSSLDSHYRSPDTLTASNTSTNPSTLDTPIPFIHTSLFTQENAQFIKDLPQHEVSQLLTPFRKGILDPTSTLAVRDAITNEVKVIPGRQLLDVTKDEGMYTPSNHTYETVPSLAGDDDFLLPNENSSENQNAAIKHRKLFISLAVIASISLAIIVTVILVLAFSGAENGSQGNSTSSTTSSVSHPSPTPNETESTPLTNATAESIHTTAKSGGGGVEPKSTSTTTRLHKPASTSTPRIPPSAPTHDIPPSTSTPNSTPSTTPSATPGSTATPFIPPSTSTPYNTKSETPSTAHTSTDFHHVKAYSEVPLSIQGISRPFVLGQLYDATKDKLVTGFDLWNKTTVDKSASIILLPNTASQLIVGSSFSKKVTGLDISAEITISILVGLIKAHGAAKYLHSATASHYVAEVSLQYHRRTHGAYLGMEVLDKVQYPSVFDKNTGATHVVTAIEYGADAFLQFRKELTSANEEKEMEGKLAADINQGLAKAEGSGALNLTDSEKRDFSNISCTFNGDVELSKPPTTLLEAIEIFKTIPGLINMNTAVPITVYLTPLSLLDSKASQNDKQKASRMVRMISRKLVTQVSDRFDHYDEIQLSIGDLERSRAYGLLPLFKNQINEFISAFIVHKNKFQVQLLDVVPKIRVGAVDEKELMNILEKSRQRCDQLSLWITLKQKEAGALEYLLSYNPSLLVTKPGEFEKILYNTKYEYVISLTLQLYPKEDTFTQCVAYDCGSANASTYPCSKLNCANLDESSRSSWINDAPFAYMLYDQFLKFMEAVDMNANEPSTIMIIREHYWQNDEEHKGTMYTQITEIYHKMQRVEKDFEPTVNQSLTSHDCSESIVSWNIYGSGSTSNLLSGDYIVKHRPALDNWTEVSLTGQNKIHLRYGQNQDFQVVVFALCSFGVCAVSDEVIYRKTSDNPDCLPKPYSKVLIVGGRSSQALSSMEIYNPFNPQLNQVIEVDMIQQRYDHTSALMADGTVITVGGYYHGYLTACEHFNPFTSTVSLCPSLNTARRYAASSVLNGVLYVCGGYDGKNYFQSCERFLSYVWQGSVPMNTKRHQFAMVSFNGSLYAIGGHDGSKALSSVERRGVTDQQWTKVQSMNNQRNGHSATVMGGQIYVCGPGKTCEQYDPTFNIWTNIEIMNQGRSYFGLVSDQFSLFALGGDLSRYLTVEMFNGKNRKWKIMTNELIYPRSGASTVLMGQLESLF